ncbi:MAG: MATE family efflux transporter [Victivallales bacterium]|nr:MATE family efflux transporter [Victivallales bacterium]
MSARLWNSFAAMFSRRQFLEPGGYFEIWRLAWPLIILSASNTVMMVVNRIFLAKNSPEEIAASMPAGQMFFTLMAFFLITTGFTATVVSQYYGAANRDGCVRTAWNGFYFGTSVAALLALLLPLGGKWIFLHNGHDPQIANYEIEYFTGMAPCAGLTCMETAFFSFFTGRGRTSFVAKVKIIGCCINIPLNYLLIFGKLGLPALGILGAGLANSIANLCTLAIAATCFLLHDQREYATRSNRNFDWAIFRKLLCFGTPAGLQAFIRNAAFAIVVMMIGYTGNEALAATSIALSINMIGNMPMIGLMDATSIITGQYIGRRRLLVAERICWRSWRMLIAWMAFAALFYLFCPELLAHLFSSRGGSTGMDTELTERLVVTVLHWAIVFNIFDATRFIAMGSLRGAGDTKIPLLIGVSTSWLIQIPGTVLMVYFINSSLFAIWGLLTFYLGVDAFLMVLRRRSGVWKTIKVIDLPPAPGEEEVTES